LGATREKPFAEVICTRRSATVRSGIEDLLILKTTGSGFEKFARDEYTTLRDTTDRILATNAMAAWLYRKKPGSYSATNRKILGAMLEVFAERYSPSVQTTLYEMGEAALKAAPEISEVTLRLPNQHCLLIDLSPFGLENKNEIFVPTEEPHGVIEATVTR
jgi:urate oxidase